MQSNGTGILKAIRGGLGTDGLLQFPSRREQHRCDRTKNLKTLNANRDKMPSLGLSVPNAPVRLGFGQGQLWGARERCNCTIHAKRWSGELYCYYKT